MCGCCLTHSQVDECASLDRPREHNPARHPFKPLGMAESRCIQSLELTEVDPCPVFRQVHLLKLQGVRHFLDKLIWGKCSLGRVAHESSILLVHEHRARCLIYGFSP